MGERPRSSIYRTTLICIDSYDDGVPTGKISNPYLPEPLPFRGAVPMLKQMERLLDEMNFPQAFTERRSFGPRPPAEELAEAPPGTPAPTGRLATFSVNIMFRQNASWQGAVTWLDGKQEENFRSVLELLLLMDSALSA